MRKEYVLTIVSFLFYLGFFFISNFFVSLGLSYSVSLFVSLSIPFFLMSFVIYSLNKNSILKDNTWPILLYIFVIGTFIILLFLSSFSFFFSGNAKLDADNVHIQLLPVASELNPVTWIDDEFNLKKTKTVSRINFFSLDRECSLNTVVDILCSPSSSMGASVISPSDFFEIVQSPFKSKLGQSNLLYFELIPNSNLLDDSYDCNFQVLCGGDVVAERPISISITS